MVIKRGTIHWAKLNNPRESEPGFRRPIIIISANAFNRSSIHTVLAAVITSNTRLKDAPGNVFLPGTKSGLPRDSVVNVSQLITLDKNFIGDQIGKLPPAYLTKLENGIRLVLDLPA